MKKITEKEYITITDDVNKSITKLLFSCYFMDIDDYKEHIDLLNELNMTLKTYSERNGWSNRLDQKGIDLLNKIYTEITK